MTCFALNSTSEYSQWLAHLRHELYTPLSAIQGYSELLLEELESNETAQLDLVQLLSCCNQLGCKLLSCISQFMNGDGAGGEAKQAELAGGVESRATTACDRSIWNRSWTQLVQSVFLQHLQPICSELAQVSTQLVNLAPLRFTADVEKIAIAVNNLQLLIAAVSQSQSWPCELRLQELQQSQELAVAQESPLFRSDCIFDASDTNAGSTNDSIISAQATVEPATQETLKATEGITAQASSLAQMSLPQTSSKSAANVLVVDDNGANCDLLCRYILRQGHQVFPVDGGLEAIAQIKTGAYDLILLDILMPEMNGYEVLEWIRSSEWRHLSVIMISSLDELDSVVKCIEMGAADYLPKPFNPVLLKARVDACLEKKRMRDQEVQYLDKLAIANSQITSLNAQLQEENGRLSAELDISRKIQQMMLPRPKELAQIEDLDLVGFMKPADEIGGDYYDVIRQKDGVTIGIGDVTGHGLESGLLMLMIQTAVRTLVEQGGCDHKEFLDVINRTILSNAGRMETSRNATLSLIQYRAGRLKISGQHEEVIIIRNGGLIEYIDTIDLGFPMGLDDDIYDFLGKTEIELNLKDIVILYTDGITEAENMQGQFYGVERLSQVAAQHRLSSASDIRDAVVGDLTHYINGCKIFDDITLVVMKRNA